MINGRNKEGFQKVLNKLIQIQSKKDTSVEKSVDSHSNIEKFMEGMYYGDKPPEKEVIDKLSERITKYEANMEDYHKKEIRNVLDSLNKEKKLSIKNASVEEIMKVVSKGSNKAQEAIKKSLMIIPYSEKFTVLVHSDKMDNKDFKKINEVYKSYLDHKNDFREHWEKINAMRKDNKQGTRKNFLEIHSKKKFERVVKRKKRV